MFDALERVGLDRCLLWQDRQSGLRAIVAIDNLARGAAVGGIRTRRYPTYDAALQDATDLARAMTFKCALAGLPTGGCKIVVLDHDALDRPAAFAELGRRLAELGGLVLTGADLGTTADDLAAARVHSNQVHSDHGNVSRSVARGILRCIEAVLDHRKPTLASNQRLAIKVAIQGVGSVGMEIARTLWEQGATLIVSDVHAGRLQSCLAAFPERCEVVSPDTLLLSSVDILIPAAVGGVIDAEVAATCKAWAIVSAANNAIVPEAQLTLRERGIAVVPDIIASAGGVADGIGKSVLGLADRGPLIDGLKMTATEALKEAEHLGCTTQEAAVSIAQRRLQAKPVRRVVRFTDRNT